MPKKNIKYLVMDVDGTLTDGTLYISNNGELFKAFNVKDGLGISSIAIPNDIEPIVFSCRKSKIVENRCKEIGIRFVYQGIRDKAEKILQICSDLSEVAYIGDDLNDLSPMKIVKSYGGIIGCPKDAAKEILEMADYISLKKGGQGAVRDFIEWLVGGNDAKLHN